MKKSVVLYLVFLDKILSWFFLLRLTEKVCTAIFTIALPVRRIICFPREMLARLSRVSRILVSHKNLMRQCLETQFIRDLSYKIPILIRLFFRAGTNRNKTEQVCISAADD